MGTLINLKCESCNKEFYRTLGQQNASLKRGDKHSFCSPSCVSKYQTIDDILLVCKHCGIEFKRKSTKVIDPEKVFCSRACACSKNKNRLGTGQNRTTRLNSVCLCGQLKTRRGSSCRNCFIHSLPLIDSMTKGELSQKAKYWVQWRVKITKRARKIYKDSGRPRECFICKYKAHVDICHIKDVASFSNEVKISEINAIDNLVALCRNHHWEFDHKLITLCGQELFKNQ